MTAATTQPRRRGRPRTTMTDEAVESILRYVRAGSYPEVAARAAGVAPSTMRAFKARNRAFADEISKAEAVCELSHVAVIHRDSLKEVGVSIKFLERRFPERWARAEIRAELTVNNISAADIVAGIHAGLAKLAAIHAPFHEPDVDADGDLSPLQQAEAAARTDTEPPIARS